MNTRAYPAHRSTLDRAADRLLMLDSPIYGDERQRRVTLEACALGWVLGVFATQLAGVLAATLGAVGASIGFMVLAILLTVPTLWYAKRRAVSMDELARRDPRLLRLSQAASFFIMAAWCAALAFYAYAGYPLLDLGDPFSLENGGSDVVGGMAIGGLVGGCAGGLMQLVMSRRKSKPEPELEPDDEF